MNDIYSYILERLEIVDRFYEPIAEIEEIFRQKKYQKIVGTDLDSYYEPFIEWIKSSEEILKQYRDSKNNFSKNELLFEETIGNSEFFFFEGVVQWVKSVVETKRLEDERCLQAIEAMVL